MERDIQRLFSMQIPTNNVHTAKTFESNTDLDSRLDRHRRVLRRLKGKIFVVATVFEATNPSPTFEYLFLLAPLFPATLELSPNKVVKDAERWCECNLCAAAPKDKEGEGRGLSRGGARRVHHRPFDSGLSCRFKQNQHPDIDEDAPKISLVTTQQQVSAGPCPFVSA